MYRSSEAGKVGESGTAIACEARMDSSVTAPYRQYMPPQKQQNRRNGLEREQWIPTYIVIPILNQKRNALACRTLPARIFLQLILRRRNIIHQLAIREATPRDRMYHSRRLGIVLLDGLEDGQAG